MTKLCIKILVKSDSAIESAFPWDLDQKWGEAWSAWGNASAFPEVSFFSLTYRFMWKSEGFLCIIE